MQWNAAPHGGFTTGTPWIQANPNFEEVNVEHDMAHGDSIFAHYRRLIALRKESDLVTFGHTVQLMQDDPDIIAFERRLGDERLFVIANFTAQDRDRDLPEDLAGQAECLAWSHAPRGEIPRLLRLAPYESLAWKL